jgi:hypothetical protein
MIEKIADIKDQLAELASVLNTFKSEAVQLRLLELIFSGGLNEAGGAKTQTRKQSRNRKPAVKPPADQTSIKQPAKKKSAPSGDGANATLNQLTQGSFFNEPHTLNDIIVHCKHNLAKTFKANEFSGKLARMVRTGELTRQKNADNQYEYKKA